MQLLYCSISPDCIKSSSKSAITTIPYLPLDTALDICSISASRANLLNKVPRVLECLSAQSARVPECLIARSTQMSECPNV